MLPGFRSRWTIPCRWALSRGVGDLDRNLQCLIQRQGTLFQPLGQRLAHQVLHDQEVDAVLLADIEDGADVRMAQGGDRLGLALEPLFQIGIRRDMLGKHLDGDGAVEAGVTGLVDLAHAARAEGGVDLVGAEGGARLQGHGIS